MIKGIAHVCLTATDLAATERFYCSTLGFGKVFDFLRGGEIIGFYLRVAPGAFIEVFRRAEAIPAGPAPIAHICLEVTDVDEVSRRLKADGHEVTEKKLGADQSWQIWTTDPGGVRIEFHQYTATSSQVTGRNCVLG